jgi:hypothetical protein
MTYVPETTTSRQCDVDFARERTRQTHSLVRMACVIALCEAVVLYLKPIWPVAIGVAALCGMGVFISYMVLVKE